MRRRELVAGLVAATAFSPLAARAQQKTVPVIGILNSFSPPPNRTGGPVGQGLSESGYVARRNVVFEPRWAENHYDRLPALAADLVSRKVDMIVTIGGPPAAMARKTRPRQSRSSSPP